MAVDLAKLSLWLATLARDHPFTFLDHALRHGDSWSASTAARSQISLEAQARELRRSASRGSSTRVAELRRQIREAPEGTSDGHYEKGCRLPTSFIDPGRRYGDLVISAFFAAENEAQREGRDSKFLRLTSLRASRFDLGRGTTGSAPHSRSSQRAPPYPSFHWEIEFPECSNEILGFRCYRGNPPFLGGPSSPTFLAAVYQRMATSEPTIKPRQCGFIAYFFRRSF